MSKQPHSSLPFRMIGSNPVFIVSGTEHVVARLMSTEQRANQWADMKLNADFIVTACNAHDDLVAAMTECYEALESGFIANPSAASARMRDRLEKKTKAALEKAQSQETTA